MSFLLDTNVISEHLRRPSGLTHRFVQHSGRLYTSTICLAELYVWAFRRDRSTPVVATLNQLLEDIVAPLVFDNDCAEEFGRLRINLRSRGLGIDGMDLMIAATATLYDLTLVTHNTAHFQEIPGLRLRDWHID